jgi:hypothetical protein
MGRERRFDMSQSISTKMGLTFIISVMVILLATTSFAQPQGKGPGGPGGPGGGGFMARFDANGDGVVARDEFGGPAEHFIMFDKNQDGFVSEDEAPTGPPEGKGPGGKGPGGPPQS